MRGGHVARLVKFRPVVYEEIELRTDGWTDEHLKKIVSLGPITMRGSDVASSVEFSPVV